MMQEILIVDDEAEIRKLLRITLESSDFKVLEAHDGKTAISVATNHQPDLILLDLGLPDENGQSVLKKLRQWYSRPVIILSVQSGEEEIVTALDNGANDYLIKPFRSGELLARIRSLLRNQLREQVISSEDLEIDLSRRIVKKNGQLIKLTATEFDLLALLAGNEGRVLTHRFLLKEIWGPGYLDQSQYLRVFIAQLRRKIEIEPNQPAHIITESGVGYRFLIK